MSDYWSTKAEMEFISALGSWSQATRLPRKELLELYLKSLYSRVDFGNIDPVKVRNFAERSLRHGPQSVD